MCNSRLKLQNRSQALLLLKKFIKTIKEIKNLNYSVTIMVCQRAVSLEIETKDEMMRRWSPICFKGGIDSQLRPTGLRRTLGDTNIGSRFAAMLETDRCFNSTGILLDMYASNVLKGYLMTVNTPFQLLAKNDNTPTNHTTRFRALF